jgi:DNA processing protein
VWQFVEAMGPVLAARRIREASAPPAVHAATEARRGCDPEVDLDAARRCGLRLVVPESGEWPHFALATLQRAGERLSLPSAAGRRRAVAQGGALRDIASDDEALPDSAARREAMSVRGALRAIARDDEALPDPAAQREAIRVSATGRPPSSAAAAWAEERGSAAALVPPLALWVRGTAELSTLGVRSVGVVGARAATAYGDHVARDLAFGLARAGVVVVSGGAYGIDAAAHTAALAAGGCTVLVSAGGLDRPYPASHARLYEKVAESGLLLSESPPGCVPQRHRFLSRNRLIAALSTGVVIVEAALRSGAANTASHAAALGRVVMAVPGPITSPMSAGCHRLLRLQPTPATLVTSVDDVLAMVGSPGEGLAEPGDMHPAEDVRDELERLDPVARRVFDGLPATRFAGLEEIAARSGVPGVAVLRAMPLLDLADLVESGHDGYRIAARLRRRR